MAKLIRSNEFRDLDQISRTQKFPRMLYAGMTTGKTTLLETLRKPAIDTDVVWEYLFDDWDTIRAFRLANGNSQAGTNGAIAMSLLAAALADLPIVTQMNFREVCPKVRFPSSWLVYRNPQDAVELYIKRRKSKGKTWTEQDLENCLKHSLSLQREALHYADAYSTVIELGADEYLLSLFGRMPDFRGNHDAQSNSFARAIWVNRVLPDLDSVTCSGYGRVPKMKSR